MLNNRNDKIPSGARNIRIFDGLGILRIISAGFRSVCTRKICLKKHKKQKKNHVIFFIVQKTATRAAAAAAALTFFSCIRDTPCTESEKLGDGGRMRIYLKKIFIYFLFNFLFFFYAVIPVCARIFSARTLFRPHTLFAGAEIKTTARRHRRHHAVLAVYGPGRPRRRRADERPAESKMAAGRARAVPGTSSPFKTTLASPPPPPPRF